MSAILGDDNEQKREEERDRQMRIAVERQLLRELRKFFEDDYAYGSDHL